MKKVSVIVPVYNVENYLPKCLDALVAQTLEAIEILVINDGSQDRSQQIMEDYQARYPEKIKIFAKPNGGLSDARNYGLDHANGEFIGFVDSDDYVLPTMFEEMYTLAKRHTAEMVVCNIQKVNEHGEVTQKLTQLPHLPEKIELKAHFSVFSDLSYFACNKLFHRDLFKNHRFKKGIHFEDIELVPQLLLQCKTIARTPVYHYQYLERSDSITKSHTERGLDILNAVKSVELAFEQSDYHNFKKELKGFQILEGVYTYLAYLAFVKDERVYKKMASKLKEFIKEREISVKEILQYRRFDENYLLSLPFKKQAYYLLYFSGLEGVRRKLM
ncbi:glycosyltransferase family 2 protein [Riemerella columbina]|uniref:glycosyltransferase family 2 protein n=1 Tax=Riemerella columbina TaxID=103810 RepID=UPI00266F039B|nr:glycosyltransferase [Riemerella columbina]WKS95268.1 glycosyltransferase [Riemerella columbina]